MKNRFINIIAAIAIIAFSITLIAPLSVHAEDICNKAGISNEVKEAAGCNVTSNIESIVGNIIQVIIGILGLVAVGFIILGGVQYMTSAGDVNKAKKARDTILYACIGLVIAALAFAITNFVIGAINSSTTP